MRNAIAIMLLAVVSNNVFAEWVVLGGNDEFTTYVDSTTMRKTGNLVKMWNLKDFKASVAESGYAFLSSKEQREYDCQEEMTQLLSLVKYSGNMGNGGVVFSGSPASPKRISVVPGSAGEAEWQFACGKK